MERRSSGFLGALLLGASLCVVSFPAGAQEQPSDECTIGAASRRATKDGRPMIWKTRDTGSDDNAVALVTSFRIPFLAVVDAGDRQSSWMSLNARGFAILNSIAYDLSRGPSGLSNGPFMALASGTCATVAEFQQLLDDTNVTGRQTYANFVVMDSTGAAAIYETSGSAYWKYDATDSIAYPEGYVLRTNFTVHGGGLNGIERFNRTSALFQSFSAGDSITPKSILRYQMRDFASPAGVPYAIPYHGSVGGAPWGYLPADLTICRVISASGAVMQGIRPGETANMSTFWVILGCPATGIAVPYWVVGPPPSVSSDVPTAALNDTANAIKVQIRGTSTWSSYIKSLRLRNDDGTGLWPQLFATEDRIFASADSLNALWRAGQCSASDLLAAEATYAGMALATLSSSLGVLKTTSVEEGASIPEGSMLAQNYPNPFNPTTEIRYQVSGVMHVSLRVYDLLGREVAVLVNEAKPPGTYSVTFDAAGLSSGMYLYRLTAGSTVETKRLLLLR